MLKRTLTIGILVVLTLVLAAAAPPPPPTPEAGGQPTLDETLHWIEHGTPGALAPDGEVTMIVDGTEISIFWFNVDTSLPEIYPPATDQGDPPPAWVPEIPRALIDRLPPDVLAFYSDDGTPSNSGGEGATASQSFPCNRYINPPVKSGSSGVYADAYLNCGGVSNVSRTRLALTLERVAPYKRLDTSDGGWLRVLRQSRSVSGACSTGTYKYQHRGRFGVRLTNGAEYNLNGSRTANITC